MLLVAINPIAGQGRGAILAQELGNYLLAHNQKYRIVTGSSANNLQINLRKLIESSPAFEEIRLVAVGGDGLIHLCLQVAIEFNLPLVPIPAGTGNDFVRSLGWSTNNWEEIVWRSMNTSPVQVDLGLVDGEYFGAVLSTGFDSVVNERANRLSWPKSAQKYNLAIALELPKFKPKRYLIEIDGEVIERQAMLIAVGNGKSYGGGMNVCPGAKMDDGMFEIMILNPVTKFEFLKVFPSVYTGQHIHHPEVEIFTGKSIRIDSDAIAYADGERIGKTPITAIIKPNILKTWVA
jgi:diacylglycerol kinase (ATP)